MKDHQIIVKTRYFLPAVGTPTRYQQHMKADVYAMMQPYRIGRLADYEGVLVAFLRV